MTQQQRSFWFTPKGLAALGLIGAASYFLLMEHRQHVWQYLPFLIILLCPLMHVFMHGRHGGHGSHGDQADDESEAEAYKRGLEDGRRQNENRHHH